MTRIASALLVLMCFAGSAHVGAQARITPELVPGDVPGRLGEIRFVSHLSLEAVSANEITYGPPASTVDMGRWDTRSPSHQIVPVRMQVTRSIPAVWRVRLANTHKPTAMDVRYEVFGANGAPRRLTHIHHPEAELGVVVEPIHPRVIESDDAGAVLEGGFVLQLSLDRTRYAGEYSGTVVVSFNTF